eukprot:UN12280
MSRTEKQSRTMINQQVIRKLDRKRLVNKFIIQETNKIYSRMIYDLMQIYNLNNIHVIYQSPRKDEFKNIIDNFTYYRDLTKIRTDPNNLILYVFQIQIESKLNKPYSMKYLKIIDRFTSAFRINIEFIVQILRMITGGHKIFYDELNRHQCILCNQVLNCNWNFHVLNGLCEQIQFQNIDYVIENIELKTYEKGCFRR